MAILLKIRKNRKDEALVSLNLQENGILILLGFPIVVTSIWIYV